jgi:hypothetical protein
MSFELAFSVFVQRLLPGRGGGGYWYLGNLLGLPFPALFLLGPYLLLYPRQVSMQLLLSGGALCALQNRLSSGGVAWSLCFTVGHSLGIAICVCSPALQP